MVIEIITSQIKRVLNYYVRIQNLTTHPHILLQLSYLNNDVLNVPRKTNYNIHVHTVTYTLGMS